MARSLLPSFWREDIQNPLHSLRREFDDLLDTFWGRYELPDSPPALTDFRPRVNVSETDRELEITADLPGVEEKDLDVTVYGNQLVIKGEKKSETEEKKEEKGRAFHRVERSCGAFQRTMALPFDIDPEKVDASFKNGVLTVRLAKPQELQQKCKKIAINSEP